MNESNGYAVFFFPQALEVLGDAIKPYLQDGPAGAHVLCNEIDTGGALIEMTLRGRTADGKELALELMVPSSMVRMMVSTHSDGNVRLRPARRHETRSGTRVAATRSDRGPGGRALAGIAEYRHGNTQALIPAQPRSSTRQSRPVNASSGRKRRL